MISGYQISYFFAFIVLHTDKKFANKLLFTYCSSVQVRIFNLKMKSLQLRLEKYSIMFLIKSKSLQQ